MNKCEETTFIFFEFIYCYWSGFQFQYPTIQSMVILVCLHGKQEIQGSSPSICKKKVLTY